MTPWGPARLVTCPGTLSLLQCSGIWPPAPDKPTVSPGSRCSCISNSTEPSRLHLLAQRDGRNRRGLLGAAGSPRGKQHEFRDPTLFLHPVSSHFSAELGVRRKQSPAACCSPPPGDPILPDPVQKATHVPPHGAELFPGTRNITAALPTTIHFCLN